MLNKILSVSNKQLDLIDASSGMNIINHRKELICSASSVEHYKLLAYISTLFNKQTLFDIGTHDGLSALALSYNKAINVKSYDINRTKISYNYTEKINIKYIIGNALKDEDLKKSPFIFLDTKHDGIFENQLYNHLIKIDYKGLLMLDDIILNDAMRKFWNDIKHDKYDLIKKGHWSGTGLVNFR
ncbi:hypothetical protein ES703_44270 [subsurface metagenome]